MNKLGYTKKIMLLGGINFIALAVVIFSIYTQLNKDIRATELELEGVIIIKPILAVIQSLQRHRGLSAGVLGGHSEFIRQLSLEAIIKKQKLNSLVQFLPNSTVASSLWEDIVLENKQIQAKGLNWTKEENFSAHLRLITKLQRLIFETADQYNLTLDPDLASYYLISTTIKDMPLVLEQLGQMRAYGTGILVKKNITEQQKIKLYSLLTTQTNAFESLVHNINKTSYFNEQIKIKLLSVTEDIKASSKIMTEYVYSDILTERFESDPQSFFILSTQTIIAGYEQIYQTLLPTLEQLLNTRLQRAKKELVLCIGIAFLLALIAQYLFLGIYYGNITNIKLLTRSALKYAQGDMRQRIHLNTKDDFKQIGDSFNEMADSFNALLLSHLEDKDRLQSIIHTALDAVIQINAKGKVTGWSHQAENIFGWTEKEVIGNDLHLLIIPEKYRKKHLSGIRRYLKTGEEKLINSCFQISGLHRQGYEFPIEMSMSSVNTANGIEFSAFIRDLTEQKQTEETLQKLSLAVEQSPNSIIITDNKANIEYANKTFLKTTGYKINEIIGKNTRILSAKKTPKKTYHALWNQLKQGKTWQGELINRRKDGSEFTELAHISPVRQKSGKITHYLAIKEDITEKKQAEIELGIAAIAFESQEGIMVTDALNRILRVNQSFTKITGFSANDVIGKTPNILNSGRQGQSFYLAMWESIFNKGTWQGEIWNRHKDGTIYPEWLTITARKDAENIITHYVAIFTDITEFKAAEEKIKHLAYYDPLTLLPNRRKLLDRLDHGVAKCLREDTKIALLMLDLDRFKMVNDNFGHLAGDELLQQVARRINKRIRETDLLARLGGDEFVVLLEDIHHPDDAARIAEEIVLDLSKPFQLNKANDIQIGASIGISLYPEHANSTALLMDHADMALYQAKDKGRGCYSFFSEQLTLHVRKRLKLETDLRQAIINQHLRVFYQPQVDVLTGELIGAEALVRWQVNKNTLVLPTEFIPIAEESGLILEIGEWVLLETCRQGQQWIKEGLKPITLAVNVSAQQFKRCHIYDLVARILAQTGFPASHLELELTESGLMEQQDTVIENLNQLRTLGILLAIDDFGTGYSSLAYLKRFPLDTLKIDKSFIEDIPQDQDSVEIATTIIAMGNTLGFKVLAEGVENKKQLDFLQKIGCDSFQGYYKSKALPAEEFSELLRNSQ